MPVHSLALLRRRAHVSLLLVAALAIAGCSSGSSSGPNDSSSASSTSASTPGASGFDGAALPAGVSPPKFTLRDQAGARVSLGDYHGQVVIVAVLYSGCGSACVVIAQQIRGALDELPGPVPVLVISADPQGDTPARVKRFLAQVSLSGRVRYLTGSRAQLRPIWHAFRVLPASAGRAAFARSASVFLIDRSGQERVIYQLEQLTPEALSHDVRKLLG
ncbi:MAG TPA: SCO family protein [Solirubrobacteraceae bacterium]|jgi:protein SCO1/2|nr:SCO family protein [Solirubrobacteraceae bacterium]